MEETGDDSQSSGGSDGHLLELESMVASQGKKCDMMLWFKTSSQDVTWRRNRSLPTKVCR